MANKTDLCPQCKHQVQAHGRLGCVNDADCICDYTMREASMQCDCAALEAAARAVVRASKKANSMSWSPVDAPIKKLADLLRKDK